MKSAPNHVVLLVTAPDLKSARALAQAALNARLVACANLVPRVESHYWWQGELQSSTEVLLLLKTTRAKLKALERCLLDRHPYDTPEILVLPIALGNPRYLDWLAASVGSELRDGGSPPSM